MKIIKQTTEIAKEIEEKLKKNDGYCPCAMVKSKATKCMCKDFRKQKTSGYCFCGLYYKDMEA